MKPLKCSYNFDAKKLGKEVVRQLLFTAQVTSDTLRTN